MSMSRAHHLRDSWRETLAFRVPEDFDLRNIRTGKGASYFIGRLPNPQRGIAAKRLFEHRHMIGDRVAFHGLMAAWNHDHLQLLLAFGSDVAVAAAIRELNPAPKGKAPVIAWRGTDRIDGSLGLSWTTKRCVACWFAIRSAANTPFVFRYLFHPDDIVARYNGRHEHELIVDPLRIDFQRVMLEDGCREWARTHAVDISCHADVSPDAIADWQAGAERCSAFIKAGQDRMLRKAREQHDRSF
jgi:hypothetical protein